jgi:hypothetical protein
MKLRPAKTYAEYLAAVATMDKAELSAEIVAWFRTSRRIANTLSDAQANRDAVYRNSASTFRLVSNYAGVTGFVPLGIRTRYENSVISRALMDRQIALFRKE